MTKTMNLDLSLKMAMARRGTSCGDLARHFKVSRAMVSKWRNGGSVIPTSRLSELSAFFELSASEFIALGET